MTSRERIEAILNHQQPDRVGIDYAARPEATEKLVKALGVNPGELMDRLEMDLRGAGPAIKEQASDLCYADPTVEVTDDGIYKDIWGVGFTPNETEVGEYMDLAYSPLKDVTDIRQIEEHPWPTADLWDYSMIADQARPNQDYFVGCHSRGIFEISWFLRGFDGFMMDLAMRPDWANCVMDHIKDYVMDRTRRILDAGQGMIHWVEYNDDVGGQGGILVSPAMWREFVKPRMAEFIRMCKDEYGCRIRYHCCGGMRPIIDELIEIGVDILNPLQTIAEGMEPVALKRDFGDRITFDGGIDTQDLLPHATPDEVRKETQRMIDVLGKDGGYIIAPSHVFQGDVPAENIIAVYETALGHKL